jgi:hypothetical protein
MLPSRWFFANITGSHRVSLASLWATARPPCANGEIEKFRKIKEEEEEERQEKSERKGNEVGKNSLEYIFGLTVGQRVRII